MGLFLTNEQLWDMPMATAKQRGVDPSGENGGKHISHFIGNICYGALFLAFKIAFRYKVDGIENLRRFAGKSGCVMVCNHTSYLDVIFLYLSARPKQWPRFMGRENMFENGHGFAGAMMSRVGAFPVKRDSADRSAIKRAAKMLKQGDVVCIFPEGTRRGRGTADSSLHGGAAFIARMGGVPIVPVTVRGAEKVKVKGSKRIHFPKISVEYGKPIDLSDFDSVDKKERLDVISWHAMRQCYAMFYNIEPEEVDMKGLFPDSPDYSEVIDDVLGDQED